MDMPAAKAQLIAHANENGATEQSSDNSLDSTADALLLRVAQFFGECVGGNTFCGLSIDEKRDEAGQLLSLLLVPCDLVSGEPVRRMAR